MEEDVEEDDDVTSETKLATIQDPHMMLLSKSLLLLLSTEVCVCSRRLDSKRSRHAGIYYCISVVALPPTMRIVSHGPTNPKSKIDLSRASQAHDREGRNFNSATSRKRCEENKSVKIPHSYCTGV